MYQSRIAADQLTVVATSGLAPEIDALAACNLGGHGFLRRGWYEAGSRPDNARTLVLHGCRGAALEPGRPAGIALAETACG